MITQDPKTKDFILATQFVDKYQIIDKLIDKLIDINESKNSSTKEKQIALEVLEIFGITKK